MNTEYSIVAAGAAAAEITADLAASNREQLLQRYNRRFVKNAIGLRSEQDEIMDILSSRIRREDQIFPSGEAGVYDTLWQIGETFRSGMIVDALSLPIRTETVEVCELLELDPFAVPSKGMVFIVTDQPNHILDILRLAGKDAVIAGYLTEKKARIVTVGERQRYLARPAAKERRPENGAADRGL